jgi:broad specificity phosphatase PhoE
VTTVVIGTASFSIAGGGQARVKIKLSAFGRAQVKATHGHLQAVLETVGYETEPTHKRSQDVTIL